MPVFRRILLRVNTDFAGCPAKIDAWRGDECRSVRRLRNELRASHSVCLVRHGFVGSAPVSAVLHDCSRTRHGPVLFFCAGPFGSLHVPLPSGSLPFRWPCMIVQGPDMALFCLLRRFFWFVTRSAPERLSPVPVALHDCSRTRRGLVQPFLRRFFWFVTRSASERLSPVPTALHDCSRTRRGLVLPFLRRFFGFAIRSAPERLSPVPAVLHDCSRTRYGPVLPFAPVLLVRYTFRFRTALSRSGAAVQVVQRVVPAALRVGIESIV